MQRLHPRAFVGVDAVALVEHFHHRHPLRADLGEHGAHGVHVPLAIGRRGVDDVQQQIGSGDFLERRAERGDQRMRQPLDEADRVGDQQLAPIRQLHLADQRIERDEQRVRRHRVVAASAD